MTSELKLQLGEAISAIPKEFLRSVDVIFERLEKLQENPGAHIEY